MRMGNKVVFTTILAFLFVADVSSASYLWNFRKFVSPAPIHTPNTTVSPLPSPDSGGDQQGTDKSKAKPPAPSKGMGEKDVKDKDIGEMNETCDGADRVCKDSKSLAACVKVVDDVANIMVLLIQNKGDISLAVNIRTSSVNRLKKVEVPKHQSEKVNISVDALTSQITVNAGDGDCALRISAPVSDGNFFRWLPSDNRFKTPIYGAYFLFGVTLIAGGVFACCKLRKSGKPGEIPYQELEMGDVPDSAIDVETADGWDQGWDDDWEDDRAPVVTSPRSISGNGLMARSSNKEGWKD